MTWQAMNGPHDGWGEMHRDGRDFVDLCQGPGHESQGGTDNNGIFEEDIGIHRLKCCMSEIVHAPCYHPELARQMTTNVRIPQQRLIILDRSKCFEYKSGFAGKRLEDSVGVETRVVAALLELPGESDKGNTSPCEPAALIRILIRRFRISRHRHHHTNDSSA